MVKSFVLYNILEVEGELLDCIYFMNNECRAQPILVGVSKMGEAYHPTELDQKEYCKGSDKFKECPRFVAYHEHLRLIGLHK